MKIVRFVERPGSRSSEYEENGRRRYSLAYRVKTDVPTNEIDLRRQRQMPSEGTSRYALDQRAICRRVACTMDPVSSLLWTVEAEWEAEPPETQEPQDPGQSPIQVSWGSASIETYELFDLDRKPFVDAAGLPFSQPVATPLFQLVLTIQVKQKSYDVQRARNLGNCVNSTPWFGFTRGKVKADFPEARTAEEKRGKATIRYWDVSYRFIVHGVLKYWIPTQVLNAGYKCLKNGKLVDCVDETGNPASRPMLLNADGTQMPLGRNAKPNYLEFRVYQWLDFNTLGLV